MKYCLLDKTLLEQYFRDICHQLNKVVTHFQSTLFLSLSEMNFVHFGLELPIGRW